MHTPSRRRRFPAFAVWVALAATATAGCASKSKPVDTTHLSKSSPRDAYAYLKAMIDGNQHALEWASFSPGFKRRLSDAAGRNIDVGDYTLARSTIATNSNKNMKLILESEFVKDAALSENVSVVTIRAGKKQANPRFIRMTSWELTIKGEGEPVSEFIPSTADVLGFGEDGSMSMRIPTASSTGAFLKTIPPEKIKKLVIEDLWYLDDFGGVEDVMIDGLKGKGEAPRTRGPSGTAYPVATPPPAPPPSSIHSQDAAPVDGPDGFGSPDGAPSGSPDAQPAR